MQEEDFWWWYGWGWEDDDDDMRNICMSWRAPRRTRSRWRDWSINSSRREMRRMRRGVDAGTNSLNPGLPSHDYPPLPLEDDEEPARLQQPSSPNSIINQLFECLTTLSNQLESAVELSSSLQAQHACCCEELQSLLWSGSLPRSRRSLGLPRRKIKSDLRLPSYNHLQTQLPHTRMYPHRQPLPPPPPPPARLPPPRTRNPTHSRRMLTAVYFSGCCGCGAY